MSNYFVLKTTIYIIFMAITLGGCGGGSDTSPNEDLNTPIPLPEDTVMIGQFIDDPVKGLSYTCSSGTSGITDAEGKYTCKRDDNVTFSIGSLLIGSLPVQSTMITPYVIYPNDLDKAIDLARLLQSMDSDGEIDNGVLSIGQELTDLLPAELDLNSATFVSDIEAALGIELIPADQAQRKLNRSITDLGGDVPSYASVPIADAGPDQNVHTADLVQLDGNGSHDPNGETLFYHWKVIHTPQGSSAALSDTDIIDPHFIADLDGEYVIELLTENDSGLTSAADTISIMATTFNARPIADAGKDRYVNKGALVTLDGSASSDADFDVLIYDWTFIYKPEGSSAILSDATEERPTFHADRDGTYLTRLIVDDGRAKSDFDDVNITVISNSGIADNTFNGLGHLFDDSAAGGESEDFGNAMVLDAAGNIYITGSSTNVEGDLDMVIWKYKSDGTIDTSFNGTGKVISDLNAGRRSLDSGNGITLDDLGNIYVTGYSQDDARDQVMVIWKYTRNGILDTAFDVDGILTDQNTTVRSAGNAITLDRAGNIYVTGSGTYMDENHTNIDMMLWRLKDNGTIDETFGDHGSVMHNGAAGGDGRDIGNAITLDSAGNIYVTGQSENIPDSYPEPGSDPDMVIWKYRSDGTLDSTFHEDGIVVHRDAANGYYYNDSGTGIVLDRKDNIYVTGYSDGGDDYAMVIWKYDVHGDLDTTFNGTGTVIYHNLIISMSGAIRHDYGYAITLDQAENVYITGKSINKMAIWKYTGDGRPDDTFDDDGFLFDTMGQGSAIAADAFGDIYVTGHIYNAQGNHDMAIWKYK